MKTIEVSNPFNDKPVGSVVESGLSEVLSAVDNARNSFAGNKSLAIDRYNALCKAAAVIEHDAELLAQMICSETGKPIRESRVEVSRACTTLIWSAQESLRLDGVIQPCDVTTQRLNRNAYAHRFPLGIVAAITPFNFPLNIPAHKAGPALAAGNAVILKPSPKAPLTTARFVEILQEAGFGDGMVQVLHGGANVVEALAKSNVNAVTFTGSSHVGPQVAAWAAGKKVVMELGGNGAVVVMPDADLDLAADVIVAHRFGSSGQRCTSCKRAVLHEAIYETMKEKILSRVAKLVVGDPSDEETDVGPLVDTDAAIAVENKITAAQQRGAEVLCGGLRNGNIIQPAVVENLPADDALIVDETFGPVLPLLRFDSLDSAIALVNASRYGLQAGLFTRDMPTIQRAFREIEVGALVINDGPGLRIEPIPFGGVKASGIGHEGIRYTVEEFTHLKTLIL